MLWLLSLLATFALAQNCDVSGFSKSSQKRRECSKRDGCKWSGRKELTPGVLQPGFCAGGSSCGALTQNQCKKRNTCYINWTAGGKPCQDYNPTTAYPCEQLSGKKNKKKCDGQPHCISGGGGKQAKACLDVPSNLENQDCSNFSVRSKRELCVRHSKCDWIIKEKKCVDKKTMIVSCASLNNEEGCNKNHSGCQWNGSSCLAKNCDEITDRTICNASRNDCQWYNGFVPDDYDPKKNKFDQKETTDFQNNKKETTGTCRDGLNRCKDIMVENHCKLADTKYGVTGCWWNQEAKEFGDRCSTVVPCSIHTQSTACLLGDNMKNDGTKCVWQKSGNVYRCMEYDCTHADLNSKNKCNTVGCHWHRNKDKRDPQPGFCGIYDLSKGRRL